MGRGSDRLAQHILALAARFASAGYAAIVPDLDSYRGPGAVGTPVSSQPSNRAALQTGLSKTLDYLQGLPAMDARRVAAMGIGAGGTYPHLLNSLRPEIAANIVCFGGTEGTDEAIRGSTAPTLGLFAESDPSVSVAQVLELRARLEKHRRSYEIQLLPGAPDPSFSRSAPADMAWGTILNFLERVYGGEFPPDRVRQRWFPSTHLTTVVPKYVLGEVR